MWPAFHFYSVLLIFVNFNCGRYRHCVCGRYGACCGRYGLWPISSFPSADEVLYIKAVLLACTCGLAFENNCQIRRNFPISQNLTEVMP